MEGVPDNTTVLPENTTSIPLTCPTALDTMAPEWGYITAAIAVIFYGSNFAPVKKFETGDGMFFQWVLCSGIMLTGVVLQIVRKSTFYPIVIVGGVVWATGNICVVPIIKTIGMGPGLCIWGMSNLLSGWATGRFGLFGLMPEVPDKVALNYIGVALAVFSGIVFSLIKADMHPSDEQDESPEDEHRLIQDHIPTYGGPTESLYTTTNTQDVLVFNRRRRGSSVNRTSTEKTHDDDEMFFDRLSPSSKRILGIGLSLVSGVLYGQIFTASTYVQDKTTGASQNGLDYAFACFCGIYLSSTVYFGIYTAVMRNRPRIYPRVILPGIISGIMWAIATACWFIANRVLSNAVAFPIITTIPAVVAAIWSVFVFKEIKGVRNISILLVGFCFTGAGAVMAGMSKNANAKCTL